MALHDLLVFREEDVGRREHRVLSTYYVPDGFFIRIPFIACGCMFKYATKLY